MEKNSHESRVYESVDDSILSWDISEIDGKESSCNKGLTVNNFLHICKGCDSPRQNMHRLVIVWTIKV